MCRHEALNATIHPALCSAGVPATLKAQALLRDDGKNPDGLIIVPWTKGRCLTRDATFSDTLAPTFLPLTPKAAGAGAVLGLGTIPQSSNFNYIFTI